MYEKYAIQSCVFAYTYMSYHFMQFLHTDAASAVREMQGGRESIKKKINAIIMILA